MHEVREGRKSSGVGIWRGGKMERERGGRRTRKKRKRRKKELSQIARRERETLSLVLRLYRHCAGRPNMRRNRC